MYRLTLVVLAGQLACLCACSNVAEQSTQEGIGQAMIEDPALLEDLRVAGATVLQEAWAWRAAHQVEWSQVPLAGNSTVNHAAFEELRREILRALLHANVLFYGVTEGLDPIRGARQLVLTGTPEISLERYIQNLHVTVRKGDFNGQAQYYHFVVGSRQDEKFSADDFSIVAADLVSDGESVAKLHLFLDEDHRDPSRSGNLAWDWNDCANLAAQRGFRAWYELDDTALEQMFCEQDPTCDFQDLIDHNGEWQVLSFSESNGKYCTVFNPNVADEFDPAEILPAAIVPSTN